MTHSAAEPARKASLAGLVVPWTIAIALVVGWSIWWLWLRGEAERRLEGAAAQLRAQGYIIAWDARRIGGYPFRLDIDVSNLRLREPSGWGLAAPELKTEAYAWDPARWILIAPAGGAFVRPIGGRVDVAARVLRASVRDWGLAPPRIVIEGRGLTFAPAPGAKPFFASSADQLLIATRAGPDDQGAVFLEMDGVRAQLSGLMARIAQGRPIAIKGDVIFSHASALSGRDWPQAVRAWSVAGGRLQVRQVTVAAGQALLDARSGELTVGDDGRLQGAMTATLREAPQALSAMSQAGAVKPDAARSAAQVAGESAPHVTLDFEDGQTRLGPVAIAPAPKVF